MNESDILFVLFQIKMSFFVKLIKIIFGYLFLFICITITSFFIVHIDALQPAFMRKPYYFTFWQIRIQKLQSHGNYTFW